MIKITRQDGTNHYLVRALHGSWTTIGTAETKAAAIADAKRAIARQKRYYRDDGDTGAVLAWERIERAMARLCEAEQAGVSV